MPDQHHDVLETAQHRLSPEDFGIGHLGGGDYNPSARRPMIHPKFGGMEPLEDDDDFILPEGLSEEDAEAYLKAQGLFYLSDEAIEKYLHDKYILESEINQLRAQSERKIKQKSAALQALNDRYQQRLENTIREKQKQTGEKTFHFDYGTCRMRKSGGGYKITDEEAAIEYLQREMRGALTKTILEKGAYKEFAKRQVIDRGGELPPGVDIEPESLSFAIQTASKPVATDSGDE